MHFILMKRPLQGKVCKVYNNDELKNGCGKPYL